MRPAPRLGQAGHSRGETLAEWTHAESSRKKAVQDCDNPMQRFVTVKDDTRALTVFSKDTMGYQLNLDTKRTLNLTLLRSVGKIRAAESDSPIADLKTAQSQGTHVFEYGLFPHAPGHFDEFRAINEQMEAFHLPMLAIPISDGSSDPLPESGIELAPKELTLLCFKPADLGDGIDSSHSKSDAAIGSRHTQHQNSL